MQQVFLLQSSWVRVVEIDLISKFRLRPELLEILTKLSLKWKLVEKVEENDIESAIKTQISDNSKTTVF